MKSVKRKLIDNTQTQVSKPVWDQFERDALLEIWSSTETVLSVKTMSPSRAIRRKLK
jgi:hypothetical protein